LVALSFDYIKIKEIIRGLHNGGRCVLVRVAFE
jgi:hypothetical protein